MNIDFNPKPQPKCINCGKVKGRHQAKTLNCPFNEVRRGFASFRKDKFYQILGERA